jgi:hypothetical protein
MAHTGRAPASGVARPTAASAAPTGRPDPAQGAPLGPCRPRKTPQPQRGDRIQPRVQPWDPGRAKENPRSPNGATGSSPGCNPGTLPAEENPAAPTGRPDPAQGATLGPCRPRETPQPQRGDRIQPRVQPWDPGRAKENPRSPNGATGSSPGCNPGIRDGPRKTLAAPPRRQNTGRPPLNAILFPQARRTRTLLRGVRGSGQGRRAYRVAGGHAPACGPRRRRSRSRHCFTSRIRGRARLLDGVPNGAQRSSGPCPGR